MLFSLAHECELREAELATLTKATLLLRPYLHLQIRRFLWAYRSKAEQTLNKSACAFVKPARSRTLSLAYKPRRVAATGLYAQLRLQNLRFCVQKLRFCKQGLHGLQNPCKPLACKTGGFAYKGSQLLTNHLLTKAKLLYANLAIARP